MNIDDVRNKLAITEKQPYLEQHTRMFAVASKGEEYLRLSGASSQTHYLYEAAGYRVEKNLDYYGEVSAFYVYIN